MKIEDQVCSLEHAVRLKELGVELESLWVHYRINGANAIFRGCSVTNAIVAPAYTVAELGEMLPDGNSTVEIHKDHCHAYFDRSVETYTARTMAGAMAELLIWLIENGHVNVEELNK